MSYHPLKATTIQKRINRDQAMATPTATRHFRVREICGQLRNVRSHIRAAQEAHNTKDVILFVRQKVQLRNKLAEVLQ